MPLENLTIKASISGAISVSGDGPVRLVELADTWRLVVVDGSEVIATAFEFPTSLNETDRNIPIADLDMP